MAPELLVRIFESEIASQLFPDGGFIVHARVDDRYAGSTNSVELPNAGTIPAVSVDRSSYPATIAQRTDVAHQYVMEELSTDPTHLLWHESLAPGGGRVAYNKRADVIAQHAGSLMDKAERRAIAAWVAGLTTGNGQLIPSTGGNRTAAGPSQTGNRKRLVEADVLSAKLILDRQEVPQAGRAMIITPDQHTDLILLDRFSTPDKYGAARIPSGAVGMIHGFTVYVRSYTAVTDGSNVIKAEGAAAAATDQDVAVFWHRDFVRRALGGIKAFINTDEAAYYGDILSYAMMFGAVQSRNDLKGIVAVYEDTSP